jgi:hypothetical protein
MSEHARQITITIGNGYSRDAMPSREFDRLIREVIVDAGGEILSYGSHAVCARCTGSGQIPIYVKGACIVTEHTVCPDCEGRGR